LIVLVLSGAALGLAGCTFTPVYGDYGVTQQRLEFAYAKPASRLDQIVIQDLSLKLGKSQRPSAPLITISTSAGGDRALTRTGTTKPAKQREVLVTVSFTVVVDERVVAAGSRSASALYTTSGQVLADDAAYRDATERAALAAGETVRLSILAALATPVRQASAAAGQ
jgi:hypothetical protein